MKRVTFEASAVNDISAIRDYIGRDSRVAAAHVLRGIMRAIAQLGVFPRSGRRGKVKGTYELVIRGLPYLAAYAITSNRIEVMAIVHMAKDRTRHTIR